MTAPIEAATDVVLKASGIRHSFGDGEVLRGVDLELRQGEVVALLGPNGAGKTTLMTILVGLVAAQHGTVTGAASDVGWVPQGRSTYSRLTVRENIELFARLLKLPGDARETARKAADEAGLGPWLDHLGWQLSGGLRQRLNVLVGLLGAPRTVVLDEPTTGVDLLHRTALWRGLRDPANAGRAILYSTHSIEDAQVADRIVVLVSGRIAWQGALTDLGRIDPPTAEPAPGSAAHALIELWRSFPESTR